MGDAAPGARAGRSLPRPRRRRAKDRQGWRERRSETREEKRKDQFGAPQGTQRAGPIRKPEETRGPNPGQSQAPARPRPPRRNLRSLPSSPRRAGRGASTKDSNFRAGTGPPPTPGPGPAGRSRASCERQAARGGRGWPRAGAPGRRAWEGARREGGRELLRLAGLPARPKERVSKNRQRPAGGGEERKGTRNSPPALPQERPAAPTHPRGTEGDGASALGGREGRGGPGPPREQPEHTRESRDRFRPLGFPRLRAPRRSRAPPH